MRLWQVPALLIFIYFAQDSPHLYTGAIIVGVLFGCITMWEEHQEKKQREEK